MAGNLVLIDSDTASTSASISLTGVDSTYDVYQVIVNNLKCDTDVQDVFLRFTTSGSADTSSNYDIASKVLKADGSFTDNSGVNGSSLILGDIGTGTGEQLNAVLYLFNFSNASEYSFCTMETSFYTSTPNNRGKQGGGVLTVAQATDGVHFYMGSGNIASGEFKLYGLRK